MEKCNAKCEIYSWVCGYFRPVSNWNHGKREEFKDRKTFKAKLGLVGLTGCATEQIAKSLSTKNTSGNGTVVDTHIGINADNKIPEIRSLFISGDFATTKSGTNAITYREESSASVWNASSITKKRFLSITLASKGDVPNAIKAVAAVFQTAEGRANTNGQDGRDGQDGQRVNQSVGELSKSAGTDAAKTVEGTGNNAATQK